MIRIREHNNTLKIRQSLQKIKIKICVFLFFCSFVYDGIEVPNAKSISATVEILPTTEFWLLFFPLFQWSVSSQSLYVSECCVLCVLFFSLSFPFDITHREWMSLTICSVIFSAFNTHTSMHSDATCLGVCVQAVCCVNVHSKSVWCWCVYNAHHCAGTCMSVCVTYLLFCVLSSLRWDMWIYLCTYTRNLQMLAKLFSSNQKNKKETQHTDTRELALRLRRAPHTQWVYHSHKEKILRKLINRFRVHPCFLIDGVGNVSFVSNEELTDETKCCAIQTHLLFYYIIIAFGVNKMHNK